MSILYIPKTQNRQKKVCRCKFCKSKIMWAVNTFLKSIPIEYDEKLSYLYDGIAKVNFVPGLMKEHFKVCPYSKKLKQIY